MDALSSLLVGAAIFFVLAVTVVLMNRRENSRNLRKNGSSFLREVNPMVDVLPVDRDATYPIAPHPDRPGQPRRQNVLSQNIEDTNKVPSSFTTWYDQQAADAIAAMSLYARGATTHAAYGSTNAGYVPQNTAPLVAAPLSGTAPIRVVATVSNPATYAQTQQPGYSAPTMQYTLPTGRVITIPIPHSTMRGATFVYDAPMVRMRRAGSNSANSAAIKAGFSPSEIAAGGAAVTAADVGGAWPGYAMTTPPPGQGTGTINPGLIEATDEFGNAFT
tara:strand:+ start:1790 stop:2614 length:825 start_codon:yes stop_codon:yes gene_type:complete